MIGGDFAVGSAKDSAVRAVHVQSARTEKRRGGRIVDGRPFDPGAHLALGYYAHFVVLPEVVTQKIDSLPASPGVYLFKDKKGVIVYVGKAKSLRSRVRSYFQESNSDVRQFIPFLPKLIGDLDTIVTANEKEAAILEDNLVKRHQPKFNVKLRDDKSFILMKLTQGHAWPRLEIERMHRGKEEAPQSRKPDKASKFFGPYHSATAARRTLHLVNKHFQLRTCGDIELASRRRPCLQYQIKRCPAPCVLEVDPVWYSDQVRAVAWFLDGRHDELSLELEQRMKDAARAMHFELAAVYRDQLRAIEAAREEQRVVSNDGEDRDVVGLYREGDLVEIALLCVRAGKLADVPTFALKNADIPDDEIVAAFLTQHYAREAFEGAPNVVVPQEILVPCLFEGIDGVAEWLTERRGTRVTIAQPQRGDKAHLMSLATDNARHSFIEKQRTSDDVEERLAQLQERLRLPTIPRRIECCDISHLGGSNTVGAIVALKDGVPDKKRYRSFNVKGVARMGTPIEASEDDYVGFNDDYGAMYEVLARRFRRGVKSAVAAPAPASDADPGTDSADGEWDLPDLFVVDGGRGQLAVALAAARDLGLHSLPIVALAKEKENLAGDTLVDRVYLPGQKNPIPLKSHSASLFFLARARDEAHRFSNFARKRQAKQKRFKSALDDVPGIGPVIKKSLLITLGSVAAILSATEEQLLAVPGVRKRHVDALKKALR